MCKSGILVVITSFCVCYGCYLPQVEEKLYYSDVFAYGRIKELYFGKSNLPDTKYTAEVEIYCIFKGGPLPQFINMTVPDYGSDPCVAYKLTKGTKYLLYLDTTDGIIRPFFNEEVVIDSEEIDYIPFLCDVTIEYPTGIGVDNAVETCPEPYDDPDDCTSYNPDYNDTNPFYDTDLEHYDPFDASESSTLTTEWTPSTEQTTMSSISGAVVVNVPHLHLFGFIVTTLCIYYLK